MKRCKVSHYILVTLVLMLMRTEIAAQVWPGPHPLLSSWIKVQVSQRVKSQVDTLENVFGYNDAELSFTTPLYRGKDWLTPTGMKPLAAVMLNGSGLYQDNTGDFVRDVNFIRLRLGATGMVATGLRNLYMLSMQGIVAKGENNFSFSGIYINGNALWRHRANDQWTWQLGLAYSSVFGSNRILPLAGINYTPTSQHSINFLFPFFVEYNFKASRRTGILISLRPQGGKFNIDYPVNDSLAIENINWRQRNLLLSGAIRYKVSYRFIVEPLFGFALNPKLFIDDDKYTLRSTLYARIMLRYRFGKRANVAPILNFDPVDFTNGEPGGREEF